MNYILKKLFIFKLIYFYFSQFCKNLILIRFFKIKKNYLYVYKKFHLNIYSY
jgi:hypothetical protein